MTAAGIAFDSLASNYNALWNRTAIGLSQREAVWRGMDSLFEPGDSILDVGCGNGEDALHFKSRGVVVHGVDASASMVRIARERGVDAELLAIENIGNLQRKFAGAISNFGALNCIDDLASTAQALGRVLPSGGFAALCLMSPFCLRETLHFLKRGKPREAFRRCGRGKVRTSLGLEIRYPSVSQLKTAFSASFQLVAFHGIGVCVPPSYVRGTRDATIHCLSRVDRLIADLPLIRAIGDHRLFVFRRL